MAFDGLKLDGFWDLDHGVGVHRGMEQLRLGSGMRSCIRVFG